MSILRVTEKIDPSTTWRKVHVNKRVVSVMTLSYKRTLKSAQSLGDPLFFFCHTTGGTFMTPPGSTAIMVPCAKRFANSVLTWAPMAEGFFRAQQKTCFASGLCLLGILTLTRSMRGKIFTSDEVTL